METKKEWYRCMLPEGRRFAGYIAKLDVIKRYEKDGAYILDGPYDFDEAFKFCNLPF